MGHRHLGLVFVLLLLAGAGLQAQGSASLEEVDALIAQSGYQIQIENLPRQFESSIVQSASDFDAKQVARLKEAVPKAFAVERSRATFREHLQKKLAHGDVEKVAQWHSSPLGTKIRTLELKPGNLAMANPGQGDLSTLIGAERLKRLERLDSATGTIDAALLWMDHSMKSISKIKFILWGIDTSRFDQPPEIAGQPMPLDPSMLMMEEQRMMARREGILSAAATYRELTDEELDRYLNFAESPSGRRWHQVVAEAMDLILTRGSKEVAASLSSPPG